MRFYAHIKTNSPLDITWRAEHLTRAWLEDVMFGYNAKKQVYEAGEISPVQLGKLKDNSSVVIEALGTNLLKTPTHMAPGAIQ